MSQEAIDRHQPEGATLINDDTEFGPRIKYPDQEGPQGITPKVPSTIFEQWPGLAYVNLDDGVRTVGAARMRTYSLMPGSVITVAVDNPKRVEITFMTDGGNTDAVCISHTNSGNIYEAVSLGANSTPLRIQSSNTLYAFVPVNQGLLYVVETDRP